MNTNETNEAKIKQLEELIKQKNIMKEKRRQYRMLQVGVHATCAERIFAMDRREPCGQYVTPDELFDDN